MQFGIFDWVEASDSLSPQEVYEHKLQMAAAADKAGFHGMFLAEHQGTPLSIDASPSVLLSAMFQRTQRLRAGALTWCLPWYDPYRFYNEICMLDQLSGGRLELGVGRGVSPIESLIFGLSSIEESRERYRETLDAFFAACSSPLFNFQGPRFEYRDVQLYNKPVQRPYPPLWFPSSNRDSIEFTARHGYHTALMARTADSKVLFNQYRETWEKHKGDLNRHNGHVAEPFLAKTQHIVIAESYVEAERTGLQAYETWKGHMHHLTRRYDRPEVLKLEPYSDESPLRLIVGPPHTVLERVQEVIDATGMNYLLCIFSFGSLPPQAAQRSLEMFAKEVMPRLKDPRN
jgi:alkanesulfonate monooxygenase SsuD/methylene tetrahydromethanopterin reductase-like flavin-dependent oxidoreductase (luciferase family)